MDKICDVGYVKYLKISFLILTVFSVSQWVEFGITNTIVSWLLSFFVLLCALKIKCFYKFKTVLPITLWFIILFLNFIYSLFKAKYYWDYKLGFSNLMTFSLPLISVIFCNPSLLVIILKYWLRKSWLFFLILFPFMLSDAVGRFLVPYTFLLIIFPLLSKKNKTFAIIAFLLTLIFGRDSRSDLIKFVFCGMCALLSCWNFFLKHSVCILKIFRHVILLCPFLFFTLGATNVFNIFKTPEEIGISGKYYGKSLDGNDIDLTEDNRTPLYLEVVSSSINNDYWLFGRSISRGYDTSIFAYENDLQDGPHHKGERSASEVSILNIFNYFGVVGVFAYFFIFWQATKKALYESNNIYIKMIGIYIAFRWFFGWIEDFSNFDLNMFFLWVMIGMCYSPYWRNMSDSDFKKISKCF